MLVYLVPISNWGDNSADECVVSMSAGNDYAVGGMITCIMLTWCMHQVGRGLRVMRQLTPMSHVMCYEYVGMWWVGCDDC